MATRNNETNKDSILTISKSPIRSKLVGSDFSKSDRFINSNKLYCS